METRAANASQLVEKEQWERLPADEKTHQKELDLSKTVVIVDNSLRNLVVSIPNLTTLKLNECFYKDSEALEALKI